MTDGKRVRLLVLDLDGTVRKGKDQLGHFVNAPEDVQVFPSAVARMREWKAMGGRIIAASNQGGVAMGFMTMETLAKTMEETHRQCGGLFDKIACCTHFPEAKDPEMAWCWCRKPSPGLIIEAAGSISQKYGGELYPPYMGLFVGDRPEDQECARLGGLPFMRAADWRAGMPYPKP